MGRFGESAHFSPGLPRVAGVTAQILSLQKNFFQREGKKNQMLSTWRLHPGHHSMETKATCLGGEFLAQHGFGTECPDAVYQ